jgi:3',5'-cyclic AMP phosphodiesterase CpdA
MDLRGRFADLLKARVFTRGDAGYVMVLLFLAGLSFVAPMLDETDPIPLAGTLMVVAASVSLIYSLRRVGGGSFVSVYGTASVTLVIGVLLMASEMFAAGGLRVLVSGIFLMDAVRRTALGFQQERDRLRNLLAGIANLAVALLLYFTTDQPVVWTLSIAGGLRILGIGWELVTASVHGTADAVETLLQDAGITEDPASRAAIQRLGEEEQARRPVDLAWITMFCVTLLAIHIGRMESEWTIAGLVAPFVALIGDLFVALVAAFIILLPIRLVFRKATRRPALWLFRWTLRQSPQASSPGPLRRAVRWLLERRLRFSVRMRHARYSLGAALIRGLATGLPVAAMLAATVPIWGMSWYFDSENWAAGIYNSWAEHRTDLWRMAMIREVRSGLPGNSPEDFLVAAPAGDGDFSFIIIGDTGEGDASQHILRHQLIRVAEQDEVKFVVISSDVVYPTGAMKDYEKSFWLPFHGIRKPIYAIPGNHDWYDALEGFAATFLEPDAARSVMRARLVADARISGTTEGRIEEYIAEAARLRTWYRVPTGYQRAPFFQIQTPRFGFITVDTGVLRRADPLQFEWLRSALERSRGKTTMVLLGHPLYALGTYMAEELPEFRKIHDLLKSYDVRVVMGGDTHDFEYYREKYVRNGHEGTMDHFVNGGGGAYLSMGTALAWPDRPPSEDWAFYPSRQALLEKTDRFTPWWKWPAWVWVKTYRAWPYSVEWLSAAFDYNVAPFFQSFVVVSVEPSRDRIRILPYTASGRMTWGELQHSPSQTGHGPEEFVEFTFPLNAVGQR